MVKASRKKIEYQFLNAKRRKDKTAALITIHQPGLMSPAGRRAVAGWISRIAKDFQKLGDKYTTGRFTARYLYR